MLYKVPQVKSPSGILIDIFTIETRAKQLQHFLSLLHDFISSPLSALPSTSLIDFLSSRRARSIDLSVLDEATGTTLLHEAARRKDLRLVELAVRAGADIFIRDRRGRTVSESVKNDEKVKVFLRQCAYL